METNKIYNENCLDTMAKMPDCFVDLTVTSPPYDGLRTYNGYCFNFENVAKELFRVTKQGGVVVWVVADGTKAFCESLSSFKQAIFFVESCGFGLLDTMIYHKSKYAPAYPTLRRYANTFEYMFVFSKGKPKTFNPIQQDKVLKNYKNKRSYFRQKDGSQILKIIDCDRETKDAENLWTICPTKSKGAGNHPAVFPEQLVIDHIISWSNEGELVYDPFMGSGTTAKMALLNNRKFVGSEISKEYCEIAEKRINENL
jgi:site-specific DNA-methyltransferase (adenine-specific)